MHENDDEPADPDPPAKNLRDKPDQQLPEQTADDTDVLGGDWRDATADDRDRWLHDERPPHWE